MHATNFQGHIHNRVFCGNSLCNIRGSQTPGGHACACPMQKLLSCPQAFHAHLPTALKTILALSTFEPRMHMKMTLDEFRIRHCKEMFLSTCQEYFFKYYRGGKLSCVLAKDAPLWRSI